MFEKKKAVIKKTMVAQPFPNSKLLATLMVFKRQKTQTSTLILRRDLQGDIDPLTEVFKTNKQTKCLSSWFQESIGLEPS